MKKKAGRPAKPKKQRLYRRFSVSIRDREYRAARRMAKEEGTTVSALVRRGLLRVLEERKR